MNTTEPTYRQKLVAEMDTIQRRWHEIQAEIAQLDQANHQVQHSSLYNDWLAREQRYLAQRQADEQRIGETAAANAKPFYDWQQRQLADRQRIHQEAAEAVVGARRY